MVLELPGKNGGRRLAIIMRMTALGVRKHINFKKTQPTVDGNAPMFPAVQTLTLPLHNTWIATLTNLTHVDAQQTTYSALA